MEALDCITSSQLATFKGIAEGKSELTPGYTGLDMTSQEQVRLAFKAGEVVGKDFKGIQEDGVADGFGIKLASTGYARCQYKSCKASGIKD